MFYPLRSVSQLLVIEKGCLKTLPDGELDQPEKGWNYTLSWLSTQWAVGALSQNKGCLVNKLTNEG